ncbi:NUDIX domain-containing protein [Nonomuraea turcica]|uniref:NUDIX domain-containing protein n=1 Tax=Nonomuraea sp. G32 TaxID=3067274 RepID=UPI00273C5E0A|nr:NUDIX domain-containing protein [Nonomuraea sp. G32]MDP4512012.1 NUDIX domain-containing protein [Nonomuraea sp. G32]
MSRFPGYYDVMVGGAVGVGVGESYEEAAVRELAEELGVRVPVRFLFKSSPTTKETRGLFRVRVMRVRILRVALRSW